MGLRTKVLLYLAAIHLILGTVGFLVVFENRRLLFLVEGLLVVSVIIGFLLVRAFFVPLDLIRTGGDLISERDFTSHFRSVGQPEMDALIAVFNGMIDRLREERLTLEEKNLFIEKVVQATPAGMIILDFDGRIQHLNPKALQLLEGAQDSVGLTLSEVQRTLASRLDSISPHRSEVITADGRRKIRAFRGSFLDRGFSRDFFLLEELTEELRASEKAAYDTLIRMMSHEVKNSVASVRSLLDSCRTYSVQLQPEDREDFEQALAVAINRMSNLNSFTDSLADVVRIPAPERREFELSVLVQDLLFLLQSELDERQIDVHVVAETDVVISADKNQMEQVVVNILRNAVEAIDRNGTIKVEVSMVDGCARLTIGDSGPGISSELQEKIFTPFFSTKRHGRGIGLTVINEILTNHGFEFALRNRAEGGAEFEILLPASVNPSDATLQTS